MQTKRLLSIGLIAVGILIATNIIPLTSINYINIWVYLYPGSTDSNSPDMVTQGSTLTLTAELKCYDPSLGWYSEPNDWYVSVNIYKGTTKIQTVTLLTSYDYLSGSDTAEFTGSWTPGEENTLYTLVWYVDTMDSGSDSRTTYAKTPLLEPDGVFRVNGKDSSQTTVLTLIDPKLSFTFAPSKYPDKITSVNVRIIKDNVQIQSIALTKQTDGSYTGSYTLPNYGTYVVEGYVSWSGGTLRKMSVLAIYGEEGGGNGGDGGGETPFVLPQRYLIGAILIVVGAVLYRLKARS